MNTQRTIEQQETELKELLQRVMKAPLAPITNSVEKLDRHLTVIEDLEEQMIEMRDLDLAALKQTTDESNECIRSIKSLVEDIPTDVQNRLKPLLSQEFEELQKAYHSGLEKVEIHLKGHIDAAQRLANENGTRLQTVIEFQQGQILQLLRQNESGAIQLKNELSHAHARVKHWLVVNFLLAGAGFIGIATLATRLYF